MSQGGAKTFVLKLHNSRRAIGRYPLISLSAARTEAKRLLAEKTLGKVRPQSITYGHAVQVFLEEKAARRRARTVADHTRHLSLLDFKGQLADVSHQDLERKLKKLPPSEFNHRLACAKTFFRWTQKKRYRTDDPTVGLSPHRRPKRSRVLTDEELKAVWIAAGQIEGHFGTIVRLLILCGQRPGETARLRGNYYSHNQQTICLPSELTKNGREHTFPIGKMTSGLLSSVMTSSTEQSLIFPARQRNTSFNGWSKSKKALDELSGTSGWTLHDIRRTFRTNLGKLGVAPYIAERLVNHISAQTDMEQTYDTWTYLPEMRDAMNKWEAHLSALCGIDALAHHS